MAGFGMGDRVSLKVRCEREVDGQLACSVPGFSSRIRIPKSGRAKPGQWVPISGEVIFVYDDGRRVVELDIGTKVTVEEHTLEAPESAAAGRRQAKLFDR